MITTNTDGDPISQAFAAAMAEPSVMYSMKLYRNGSDLGAVIKRAKLDLGAGQFSDDLGTFAACGVYQTQFNASLYDCPSILGDELEVRVGVLTGNAYEYVAVAYVTITEESTWKGVTDVRGVGRMGLMHAPHGLAEGDYQPAAIAAAIYAATGILVSIDARLTTQSVHADAGGTCRDALESMCARLGAYACELGEGVSVMPYSSTVTGTIPTGHVTGKPELGTLYEVDGITVEAGEESFVQGTGRVHIVDGAATATTAAATWGNMRGYAFTPATLNIALIDPRWTVADMLEVTLGEDDYSIPARGISITYDGGYFGTVSAAGLTAEAEEMTVEGPLTRSVGYARSVADEALEVAQATGQYFWHDDNGAHVSTDALNPTGPSNSLWNSLGLLIRKATNYLVSITSSAIAFYDGLGNAASNIVASFGSSGFQVGRTGESHLVGDYHSMQLVDREGGIYFDVADLRDESGNATITDSFAGDGTTATFYLGITAASTSYTVKSNGTTVTSGITKTATSFTFSTAPAVGASITATYTVTSQSAKYYTLGTRGSGNVGGMSVSEGSGCVASGFLSHAEGDGTTASGYYAHAENSGTTASGNESHAEGLNTKATGRGAHAEGLNTTASGQYSHGEGFATASSGKYSHSEGRGTTASGDYSHAEGYGTTASDNHSHAEGNATVASGISSHAQNWGTVAASQHQTAIGRFNVSDSNQTYALIVGNGTSSVARSNAMTVGWDGAVAGLTFNGFRGRKSLTTTDDIDALFETGVYYIQGNGAGGTFPSGTTGAYNSLISVGGHPSTESADSWVGKQILIAGSTLYVRSYAGSPRAWSAWGEHKPYSAPTQTSTASSIITPASGVTVTGAYYTTNGIMAQVYLTLSRSSAITANTEVTLGTIVDGKRPKQQVNGGFGTAGSQYGNVRLLAGGDVRIRATAQIAASTSFTIIFPAYMLP